MLLRRDGDDVVAIGQPAHAWVSGQLARRWGNDRFPRPEPFDEVCLGAEQHDVGMAEWDLTPTLDRDTGGPTTFMRMPLATHLELWSAAPLVAAQSAYAALLVSMHGTALYERRDLARLPAADADRVRAFLAGQRELQERLLAALAADPAQVRRNQRLIWTWDSLSLALLLDWPPYELEGVPTADGEVTVTVRDGTVDPWPFAVPEVTVRCEGRRLAGPYEDEATMRAALARAPLETIAVTLRDTAPQ